MDHIQKVFSCRFIKLNAEMTIMYFLPHRHTARWYVNIVFVVIACFAIIFHHKVYVQFATLKHGRAYCTSATKDTKYINGLIKYGGISGQRAARNYVIRMWDFLNGDSYAANALFIAKSTFGGMTESDILSSFGNVTAITNDNVYVFRCLGEVRPSSSVRVYIDFYMFSNRVNDIRIGDYLLPSKEGISPVGSKN